MAAEIACAARRPGRDGSKEWRVTGRRGAGLGSFGQSVSWEAACVVFLHVVSRLVETALRKTMEVAKLDSKRPPEERAAATRKFLSQSAAPRRQRKELEFAHVILVGDGSDAKAFYAFLQPRRLELLQLWLPQSELLSLKVLASDEVNLATVE